MQLHPYKDYQYVFMTKGKEREQLESLRVFLEGVAVRMTYDSRVGPQANDDKVV